MKHISNYEERFDAFIPTLIHSRTSQKKCMMGWGQWRREGNWCPGVANLNFVTPPKKKYMIIKYLVLVMLYVYDLIPSPYRSCIIIQPR